MSVANLRIACNGRRKDNQTGEWEDKPNYFDVTVWGAQADSCARYLAKGRPVAIDGRLDWREWEDQQGNKRQGVSIIADSVQFLSDGKDHSQDAPAASQAAPTTTTAAPIDPDDDIPF